MKDLTVDQLYTYTYCPEYFQKHLYHEGPLYDPRSPQDRFISATLRSMLSGLIQGQGVISENELVLKLVNAINKIPGFTLDNDTMLSLYKTRDFLNTNYANLKNILTINRLALGGFSIAWPSLFELDNTQYIYWPDTSRSYLNSIYFLVSYLTYKNKAQNLISFKDGEMVVRQLDLSEVNYRSCEHYLLNILKSIEASIFPVRFNCKKISCPYYSSCFISK